MSFSYHFVFCIAVFFGVGCCEHIKNEARELVDDQKRCSSEDTCIIVEYYDAVGPNNCLGPFQCFASLNENNLGDFEDEARSLAERFERCNECTMASCMDPDTVEPFCDETTGMCDWTKSDQ